MTLGIAILIARATRITAWRLIDGIVADVRCRLCPPAAAGDVGAYGAGDRLKVGLDVSRSDVIPLAGSCGLGRTSSSAATLSLVRGVGEAALANFTAELIVPSADLTTAFAALE